MSLKELTLLRQFRRVVGWSSHHRRSYFSQEAPFDTVDRQFPGVAAVDTFLSQRANRAKRVLYADKEASSNFASAVTNIAHASFITTANVTDRDGAVEMLEIHAPELSNVSKALCDGGYTGEDFAIAIEQ